MSSSVLEWFPDDFSCLEKSTSLNPHIVLWCMLFFNNHCLHHKLLLTMKDFLHKRIKEDVDTTKMFAQQKILS